MVDGLALAELTKYIGARLRRLIPEELESATEP